MMISAVRATLVTLLLSCSAFADAGPEDLDFYVGRWQCKATVFKDGAPGAHLDATGEMKRVLESHWISVHMDFMKSDTGKKDSESFEMRGYDPARKRWVHAYFANESGSFGLEESKGFIGNQMVWTPIALPGDPPDAGKERAVIVKVSPTRYSFFTETMGASGWQKTFEKTCTKSP